MKSEVRSWDAAVADEDDTAVKGRRPLDETARRRLRVEAAALQGRTCVQVLWDMRRFFDSLRPAALKDAAVAAGFPLDHLALGMALHRAPRVLRIGGHYGN